MAVTTLMNERVSIGGAVTAAARGPDRRGHPDLEGAVAGGHVPARAGRCATGGVELHPQRGALHDQHAGRPDAQGGHARAGGLGGQARLRRGEQARLRPVHGPAGQRRHAVPCGLPDDPAELVGMGSPDVRKLFLRVRANSIEGGTSEVMRNILGERVLGLPGDVRNDKELPWKDVPRS